ESVADIAAQWRAAANAVREETAGISRRLESEGVSVDIVYGLDVIERCLARMEAMVEVMVARPGPDRDEATHRLLVELVRAAHRDRSVSQVLRSNMRLLERKIVDRSGKTGEHYIARNRAEYRLIWAAAAGGGLLTVLTAAVKLKVTHAGLPLFV